LLGALLEPLSLSFHLAGLLVQIEKYRNLGPENLRHDWCQDVVDRPQRIAAGDEHVVAKRRDEDDRRVLRVLSLANQGGRLEPVHTRHVDIEQDHREIAIEQALERLAAGVGGDDVRAEVLQQRGKRQQLVGAVVDNQDRESVVRRSHAGGFGVQGSGFRQRDARLGFWGRG
jgi:hypothetical protein